MKKFMLRVMPIVLVALVAWTGSVFAIDPVEPTGGKPLTGVTNLTSTVWATVSSVVQVLAVAAVVIAGIRYMFASADAKADIKKQTIIIVVGAALVFAAVPLLRLVQDLANSLFSSAN